MVPCYPAAGTTYYATQAANIALQAAIGSRTGGEQGALAGVVNGVLQAVGATNLGAVAKGTEQLTERAKDLQQIALENPVLMKTLAATNISYSKENGWGIKANMTGAVNAIGIPGEQLNDLMKKLTNVTIGQSQRGGASVNLGINTGKGTLGINYTGDTGTFGGSFDIMERQIGSGQLSSELSYDGKQGFSVSANLSMGNGLGLGTNLDRNGVTASTIIHGSQSGTVDQNGVYTANQNFLSEINGGDLQDEVNAAIQESNAEYDALHPSEDVANDAKTKEPEGGPSGLVDLLFAGGVALFSAAAAFLAGGGSSAPTVPAGSSGAGNGGNATVGRKPEDEKDGKVKGDVGNADDPPKKQPTKEELDNFKDNIFLNTTRAATDAYLDKLDAQGVDTKEMRAHAEAQRANGVRDLTKEESQVNRLEKELAALRVDLDKASDVASFGGASRLDVGPSLVQQLDSYRKDIQDKIEAKTKELGLVKESVSSEGKSPVTARGGKEGESNSNNSQNGNGENTPSKAAKLTPEMENEVMRVYYNIDGKGDSKKKINDLYIDGKISKDQRGELEEMIDGLKARDQKKGNFTAYQAEFIKQQAEHSKAVAENKPKPAKVESPGIFDRVVNFFKDGMNWVSKKLSHETNNTKESENWFSAQFKKITSLFSSSEDPKVKPVLQHSTDLNYEIKGLNEKIPKDLKNISNPINSPEAAKQDYLNQKVKVEDAIKTTIKDKSLINEVGSFKIQGSKIVDNNGKPLPKESIDKIMRAIHENLGGEVNIHLAKMMAVNNAKEGKMEVVKDPKTGKETMTPLYRTTEVYGEKINLYGDFSGRTTIASLDLVEGRIWSNYASAIKILRKNDVDIKEIKINSTYRGGSEGHNGNSLDVREIVVNKDGKDKKITLTLDHGTNYPPEVEKFHRALLSQPGVERLLTPWSMNYKAKDSSFSGIPNKAIPFFQKPGFKTDKDEFIKVQTKKDNSTEELRKLNAALKLATDEKVKSKISDDIKIKTEVVKKDKEAFDKKFDDMENKYNGFKKMVFDDVILSWDHRHHDHYDVAKVETIKVETVKGKNGKNENRLVNEDAFSFDPSQPNL